MSKNEELKELAKPLVEYIRKNYHPHTTVIIDCVHAEVLEGVAVAKFDVEGAKEEEKQKDYEKVKTYFETELSMLPEESLDSVQCEEVMGICLKAISERN